MPFGGPQVVYCWALPTAWQLPRYGRFCSPTTVREPLRSGRPSVVRASISADGTRENDDAYRQFASMLGEGSHSDAQNADAKRAAYAEFADSLGLEGGDREDEDRKTSVAKLTPKKVEINPEDYNIFDEMLERTGGRGRKPVKGAKPYSRHITRKSTVGTEQRSGKWGVAQGDIETNTVKSQEDADSPTDSAFSLTEEEKAQAYAVMMEEFGPSSHDVVETWTPDDEVDDPESSQSLQLVTPPQRPGAPRPVEPAPQATSQADFDDRGQQDIEVDAEELLLQPKPPMPEVASSQQEKTQAMMCENVAEEMTDLAPLESPVARTSAQLDPESPSHEEHLDGQGEEQIHSFKTPELSERPIRPVRPGYLSERSQVPVEAKTSASEPPAFYANIQTAEEVTPTVLPKPRIEEFLSASAVEDSHLESSTGSDRRKQFARKQRLRSNEPAEVLKDPKLVHEIE